MSNKRCSSRCSEYLCCERYLPDRCCECKKLHKYECDLKLDVEKNLLSYKRYTIYTDNVPTYYFDAIYEIVIFNRTCEKIQEVQIQDSLFGGNAYLVNGTTLEVTVKSVNGDLTPIDAVDLCNGNLLKCPSVIEPNSVARIKLVIKGSSPNSDGLYASTLQNTALVTGEVKKCGKCYKIFPVYVKSGNINALNDRA